MFAVTRSLLLKSTNPKLLFVRIHKKLQKTYICLLKGQRFPSSVSFNVMRWFDFLVKNLSVFEFDQILLPCSICTLYRKKIMINKKLKQNPTYLPTYLSFFFFSHVNPNTYIFFALSLITKRFKFLKFEIKCS